MGQGCGKLGPSPLCKAQSHKRQLDVKEELGKLSLPSAERIRTVKIMVRNDIFHSQEIESSA